MGNSFGKPKTDDEIRNDFHYWRLDVMIKRAIDYNLRVYEDTHYWCSSERVMNLLRADYLCKGYEIDIDSHRTGITEIYQKKMGESLPPYDCTSYKPAK